VAVAGRICTHAIAGAVVVLPWTALLAAVRTTPSLRARAGEGINRTIALTAAGLGEGVALVTWASSALAVETTEARIALAPAVALAAAAGIAQASLRTGAATLALAEITSVPRGA